MLVSAGAGGDLRPCLAWWSSLAPAENLLKAGDGGLHRSRGGFMLVMHGDGVHCDRHGRDAV